MKARKTALLGILCAQAIALSFLENLIPSLPFLPPGAKPGFSNIVTMFTVLTLGLPQAMCITVFKAFFALMTRGATAFFMSLAGGVLSTLAMWAATKIKSDPFGLLGASIIAAVCHNAGQLAAAAVLTGTGAVLGYAPALLIFSLITGAVTGTVLRIVMPALEKLDGVLKAVKQVRGGVHVNHNKNTADCEVVRIPVPEKVLLPMQQHIGVPCTPTVKAGDKVSVGQIVGDSDKFLSAPIHASISGTVSAVKQATLANGVITQAVEIESDGEMRLFDGLEPPKVTGKESFLRAVRDSGLVGLGGAGFPTHVKLRIPPDKNVDTLIVNAAECEPYITVDYRECLENSWDILSSIYTLKEILGFKRVVIAAEDNKPEAFKVLKAIADRDVAEDNAVRLMTLKSKYPQGAEKMMVLSATGRKVPPGKLPADVGCVVMNVASVAFIARYLKSGKPLVSRSLTVDGSAIADPKNVRVPIGMNVGEIIDFCGGFKAEPGKIITGGPMMGLAVVNTDIPVLKQNNAILAFADDASKVKKERDCIRCGRCAAACPLSLMPTLVERYIKAKDIDRLEKSGAMVCMECGSCAYSCPAAKPLVQYMRLAKQMLREEKSKNA